MDSEYIYKFRIDTKEKTELLSEDPIDELVLRNIKALMEIGRFTFKGNPVDVDGFIYHNNRPLDIYSKDK